MIIFKHFYCFNFNFEINFLAKSKKTTEDKEYELQKIAEDLYVYNTLAFVGKNASGKTTALELLDCCYSILGDFRLEGKHYDYNDIELDMVFYHKEYLYRYTTTLQADTSLDNKAIFTKQHIYKKKYYKTKLKTIFAMDDYIELTDLGELPEDTSKVFFVLKKNLLEPFILTVLVREPILIVYYSRLYRIIKSQDEKEVDEMNKKCVFRLLW
ncbi:MAG: hypothetical protein MR274_09540 [Clostridium sp.]|nr:hypothetical protein [Clostridium sp.]